MNSIFVSPRVLSKLAQGPVYAGYFEATVSYEEDGLPVSYTIVSAPDNLVMIDDMIIFAAWGNDRDGNGVYVEFYGERSAEPRDYDLANCNLYGKLSGQEDSEMNARIYGVINNENAIKCSRFVFSGRDAEKGNFSVEGKFDIEKFISLPGVG